MTKSVYNPKVEWYFEEAGPWQDCFAELRELILASGLTEDLKWGHPCYTLGAKNVVLMHGFKEYCALLFFKGGMMADPENRLVQQTENVQVGRQMRFTGLSEIKSSAALIRMYVLEAIAVEKSGKKPELSAKKELEYPEELQQRLEEAPALRAAFEALTPGRQRAYNLFFSAPKQAKTRIARIEKYTDQILAGLGLNDEYTLSKKKS